MNTTAIEIPEAEYRTEISKVELQDVRKGDTLVTGAQSPVNVHSVKVGTKWVELRDVIGKLIIRAEVGTEVSVARDVETEESKERRLRAKKNEMIREAVAKRDVNSAQKKALAVINKAVEEGYQVSSFQMADLLAAQAEDKVYDRLGAFITNNVGREIEDKVWDEVDAYEAYRETMKERLLGSYDMTRGLSRSTSMVSNLMDDAEREATVEFIRHGILKWWN